MDFNFKSISRYTGHNWIYVLIQERFWLPEAEQKLIIYGGNNLQINIIVN